MTNTLERKLREQIANSWKYGKPTNTLSTTKTTTKTNKHKNTSRKKWREDLWLEEKESSLYKWEWAKQTTTSTTTTYLGPRETATILSRMKSCVITFHISVPTRLKSRKSKAKSESKRESALQGSMFSRACVGIAEAMLEMLPWWPQQKACYYSLRKCDCPGSLGSQGVSVRTMK